jgi:hypothetical protein
MTKRLLGVTLASALLFAACSSSTKHSKAPTPPPTTIKTSTIKAAHGAPAARISGPITGGKGINLATIPTADMKAAGYDESEYFASGTARSFVATGKTGSDGKWKALPRGRAGYRTRIVVMRPSDPAKANGTLLVEWLNVSGGVDAAPEVLYAHPEILRGYTWVGVSAQKIGIEGGTAVVPVQGVDASGIRKQDPARYASLHHPGDAFSLDIFNQVGQALRAPGPVDPLAGIHPTHVVAIGESQSAFELTTFVNAIEPIDHTFDGFYIHSRGGGATPLQGGDITAGFTGAIRIRDDAAVPVMIVETETDEQVLNYFSARQPDNAHIRMWDVAGGAHADAYLVGTTSSLLGCKGTLNQSETHYVVDAALHDLDQWVVNNTPPPVAPRLDVKIVGGAPVIQRDARGNALGGIRTPGMEAPTAVWSGIESSKSSIVCLLFGTTVPFDAATLARLYPTKQAYLAKFKAALDKDVAAGFVLPADQDALLAEAQKNKVS